MKYLLLVLLLAACIPGTNPVSPAYPAARASTPAHRAGAAGSTRCATTARVRLTRAATSAGTGCIERQRHEHHH